MNEDAKRAQEAIDKIIGRSLKGSKTSLIKSKRDDEPLGNKATYINYKSSSLLTNDDEFRPNRRVIKIVDKQVDPMLPPSFKIKKTPQGPAEKDLSGDTPILHDVESKHVKLSSEDQKKWYIPPAISNWKNTKGFAISIDKRMINGAHEEETIGQEPVINEKFGSLAEALDQADKDAREEIKMRIKLQKKLEREEIRKREESLNKIASQSREFQSRYKRDEFGNNRPTFKRSRDEEEEGKEVGEDRSKLEAARRREEVRLERRQKAERELNGGGNNKFKLQSSITSRSTPQQANSATTSAAAAAAAGATKVKNENLYDSNLFLKSSISNAKQSSDQLYTTPLFAAHDGLNDIYKSRTSNNGGGKDDDDNDDGGEAELASRGPVVFERDNSGDSVGDHKPIEYGLGR